MFKTKSIKFTSRSSIKLGESYFTFESVIEKECPEEYTEQEYEDAKKALWDECHAEVDQQIADIKDYLKIKNNR